MLTGTGSCSFMLASNSISLASFWLRSIPTCEAAAFLNRDVEKAEIWGERTGRRSMLGLAMAAADWTVIMREKARGAERAKVLAENIFAVGGLREGEDVRRRMEVRTI